MNKVIIFISLFIFIFIPSKVNAESSRIMEKLLDERVSLWDFSVFKTELALKEIAGDINGKGFLYDYGFPSDAILNDSAAVIYDIEQNRFFFRFMMYGKSDRLSKIGNYVNQETCNSVLSIIRKLLLYGNFGDQDSPATTKNKIVTRFDYLFGFNNGLEVAQITDLGLKMSGKGIEISCFMPVLER